MRDGLKVYDVDTHVEASAETIERFLSQRAKQIFPNLQQYWVPRRTRGYDNIRRRMHSLRLSRGGVGGWGADLPRYLGEAEPRADESRENQKYQGSRYPTDGGEDWDPQARVTDMDSEGIDVALMVPGGVSDTGSAEGDIEFYRANHRYLEDFCSRAPSRLKSMVVANAKWIDESVREIHAWGASKWAVGVHMVLPIDYPLDHPGLNPIWEAAQGENLPIVHHSFSTGYPGYRDLWNNPFMGRTASHPWAAMRAVASFFGSGIPDRYPDLRFAILESGFGWLPFWAKRMEDQVDYMGYVAEGLQHSMSEYMTNGRFFASIVLHEGGAMVEMVSRMINDKILMFSTDYPHPETRFPDSVDLAFSWGLDKDLTRKIMWDNAVTCFGEP